MSDIYDVVIVGAGPAGLAAAIYTARGRHKTLMLDRMIPGGQINNTERIENYPGFLNISGMDLVAKMEEQCKSFGAQIRQLAHVTAMARRDDGLLHVEINNEESILTRTIILAPGSEYRKLGVPGEDRFRQSGSGVSYCGTCDAPFFKEKTVIAVGGGNTAIQEALHLAKYVKKLYLVHRREEFRAEEILVEELYNEVKNGKIELVLDSIVTRIEGNHHVEFAHITNVKTNETTNIDCNGVFIFIGTIPTTAFLKGFVDLDYDGFIQCEPWYLRTNIPGVFTAGDCRVGAGMQLATATGDGVTAALALENYLKDPKWWNKPGP